MQTFHTLCLNVKFHQHWESSKPAEDDQVTSGGHESFVENLYLPMNLNSWNGSCADVIIAKWHFAGMKAESQFESSVPRGIDCWVSHQIYITGNTLRYLRCDGFLFVMRANNLLLLIRHIMWAALPFKPARILCLQQRATKKKNTKHSPVVLSLHSYHLH